MKNYEVKFKIKSSGSSQVQRVQAKSAGDAKKLIEAQYGDSLKMHLGVKQV